MSRMKSRFSFNDVFIKVVAILYLICMDSIGFAQPGNPAGDPDPVPIHGIIYLLAGGLILGLKKIVGNKSKRDV